MVDLTQLEMAAINANFNLADAHTHHSPNSAQREIVNRFPQLWDETRQTTQRSEEERFAQALMNFRGQPSAANLDRSFLAYSASLSMTIVANMCGVHGWTVALVEPTFDNLADILRNFGVRVLSYSEDELTNFLETGEIPTALYLAKAWMFVDPNNPTGFSAMHSEKEASRLADLVEQHDKVLLADFCFAAFLDRSAQEPQFDLYSYLDERGTSYCCIEDTGKIWPLQDAKASLLRCSFDLLPTLRNIHSTYILNVSPFVLRICSEFISLSHQDGLKDYRDLLSRNRRLVEESAGTLLLPTNQHVLTSVRWFRLNQGCASDLCSTLSSKGVHILPGTHFFWDNKCNGERYVRVALARDEERFKRSVEALRDAMNSFFTVP